MALAGLSEEQGHLLLCPRSWGSVNPYCGLSSCPRLRLQLQAKTILGMAAGSGSPKLRCCRRITYHLPFPSTLPRETVHLTLPQIPPEQSMCPVNLYRIHEVNIYEIYEATF